MIWLIANWKLVVILSLFLAAFYAGYHVRTLQYEATEKTALESRLNAIGAGTTKIIDFNQKWGTNVKDDCLNKPIPADMLILLK